MITTMPEPKQAKLQIPHTKLKNQLQAPFIVFANFFGEDGETWGFKFACTCDPTLSLEYQSVDSTESFIDSMLAARNYADEKLDVNIPMYLTTEEEVSFQQADRCYIVGKSGFQPYIDRSLNPPALAKVRGHDHFTGRFRGPAHSQCNLAHTLKKSYLPVVIHGGRRVQFHHIIRSMNHISEPTASGLSNG